ncbi:MAG: phosphatidate cytidylyltransferase [Eubacteriales bacterium]|nr:phosphatidate cytidylyltransferase [Eubacteriales bacterium]
MKQRVISGVILALAIIGLGLVGSYPLTLMVMLCGLLGYFELTRILCMPSRSKKSRRTGQEEAPARFPDAIALPGLVLSVVYYAGMVLIEWRYGAINLPGMISALDFWTLLVLALDFLLTMGIYVYTFPRRRSAQVTGALTAFLYAPVLFSFLCRTRLLPHGFFLYILIFVCSSVSDVCALAAGMAIGRHKLAPVLSPKKTIEGAIGGVLGSAAVSALVGFVLHRIDPGVNVTGIFLIIGICGSILGQTGDLAASAIKRNHGIKDYGNLIPGHGGIMDRFDSVLYTAPVIYYLSYLMLSRM